MTDDTLRKRIHELQDQNPFAPTYSVVVSVLKSEVLENRLHAGDHLKEIETAERIGVSRSTVRRAFDMLVLDGVFLRRENRGVEVAPMISTNYRQIIEIRIMLDVYASKLASARRTEDDLRCMMNAIETAYDVTPEESTQADLAFHQAIYRAANNSYILQIYDDLDMQIIRSRYLRAEDAAREMSDILADHIKLYEAIKAQDVLRAELAAEVHSRKLLDPALISQSWLLDGE